MTTLQRAHHQWATRPDDERFRDLESLYASCRNDQQESVETIVFDTKAMRVQVGNDGDLEADGGAKFTNWSFAQVCNAARKGTEPAPPPKLLTTLPTQLAADVLNCKLASSDGKSKGYIRNCPDGGMVMRALTGRDYSRIDNVETVKSVMDFKDREPNWCFPPDWSGTPSGLYKGDRDMFIFMIDDINRSIVTNTNASAKAMQREYGKGFFLSTSEVGAKAHRFTAFLFDYVCGNLFVWGARVIADVKLTHRGFIRDRIDGAMLAAYKSASMGIEEDMEALQLAMTTKVVDDDLKFMDETKQIEILVPALQKKGLPKGVATKAIKTAWKEGEDPRFTFGVAQGLTANARDTKNADRKVELSKMVNMVLPSVKVKRPKVTNAYL